MDEIKDCPNCGTTPEIVDMELDCATTAYRYACPRCHFMGGEGLNIMEAKRNWDKVCYMYIYGADYT